MRAQTLKIAEIRPAFGIEGGKVVISGSGFDPEEYANTRLEFGGVRAHILLLSPNRMVAEIPEGAKSGTVTVESKSKTVRSDAFVLGHRITASVDPVDSPTFDAEGNLFVAFSGKRGETPPVSVFKIAPDDGVTPYLSNIANATSMAVDRENNLFVSSRFEGIVYKATPKADVSVFAKDLGTPTGLAFDQAGMLYVGDRTGRILKVSPSGEVAQFAEIPESMIALHLAFDSDGNLLVTSPGLSSNNAIFMIDRYGKVVSLYSGFGRPQGLTVDSSGNIYLCEAKVGESAILRISSDGVISRLVTGPVMVGLAFDPQGNLAVASSGAVYRVPLN
jgi:sugar lactone lactonase YvrE